MPVITLSNPPAVRAPATRYSHAALVQGERRRLVISGQVGQAPDGTVPADRGGPDRPGLRQPPRGAGGARHGHRQRRQTTAFLTDRALLPAYRAARDTLFADHAPASTLLIVAGLADPRWMVEIEAEAAD